MQELVKIGLSMRGVARKTGVSYSAVHRHAEQFSKRQTVVDVSVFEGRELGYVVGFFVGDGNRIADREVDIMVQNLALTRKGMLKLLLSFSGRLRKLANVSRCIQRALGWL